ncbi:MAG: hypothetical protein AAF629_18930 [Chloroflexota bacterium]
MNMSTSYDYNLGKARYNELESELRRNISRQENLGQVKVQLSAGLANMSLSAAFGVLVVIGVVGVQVLGL